MARKLLTHEYYLPGKGLCMGRRHVCNGVLGCGIFAAGLALSLPQPAHGLTYSVDDGTQELQVGSFTTGMFTFGNQFNVVAGGETISSISIAWGRVPNGTPMTAKLWSDPNGDGSPSDAMLLSSVPGSTNNSLTNTFVIYDFPDVTLLVGQSFFVGATIIHEPAGAPAAADTSPPISNQSWAANGLDWTTTPTNIGTNFGGDLMVRATAGAASVPEPATLLLLGLALAGLGFGRRKLQ